VFTGEHRISALLIRASGSPARRPKEPTGLSI
jgi:hypothetical protein